MQLEEKWVDLVVHLKYKFHASQENAEDAAVSAYIKLKDNKNTTWGLLVKAGHEALVDNWRKDHSVYVNSVRRLRDYEKRLLLNKPVRRTQKPEIEDEPLPDSLSLETFMDDNPEWPKLKTESLEDQVCAFETVRERMMKGPDRCRCCSKLYRIDPKDQNRDIPDCKCALSNAVSKDLRFNLLRCGFHEKEITLSSHTPSPVMASWEE